MMNKMSSITFPDGSNYEITDDKARKDITEINNDINNVQGAIDDVVRTIGYTASKNFVPYPNLEKTRTDKSVTWTDNGDGTVTVNGTPTYDVWFTPCNENTEINVSLKKGKYILNGCPQGGSEDTYQLYVANSTLGIRYQDYGDGVEFTLDNDTLLGLSIKIKAGVKADNLLFKPMIRYASIQDDTYEPYVEDVQTKVNRLYDVEDIFKIVLAACTTSLTNVYTYTATKKCIVNLSGTAYYSNSVPKRIEIKKNGDILLSANGFSTTTEVLSALGTTAFAILQKDETLKVYVGYQNNGSNNIHLSGYVQYLE